MHNKGWRNITKANNDRKALWIYVGGLICGVSFLIISIINQ